METILKNPLKYKNIIKKFYTGVCNVYEKQSVTDAETFKTRPQIVMKYEKVPCRLSHSSNTTTDSYPRNTVSQDIKLFLDNDYEIKAGSQIEVTQDNVTNKYGAASEPNVFETHQEVTLNLWEDYSGRKSKRRSQDVQEDQERPSEFLR